MLAVGALAVALRGLHELAERDPAVLEGDLSTIAIGRSCARCTVRTPITMFGRPRWSGPGRRFRYDFPALSSMIRGVLSPGTGTPDDR